MKDRVAVLAHLEMKFEAFTAINKDTVIIWNAPVASDLTQGSRRDDAR